VLSVKKKQKNHISLYFCTDSEKMAFRAAEATYLITQGSYDEGKAMLLSDYTDLVLNHLKISELNIQDDVKRNLLWRIALDEYAKLPPDELRQITSHESFLLIVKGLIDKLFNKYFNEHTFLEQYDKLIAIFPSVETQIHNELKDLPFGKDLFLSKTVSGLNLRSNSNRKIAVLTEHPIYIIKAWKIFDRQNVMEKVEITRLRTDILRCRDLIFARMIFGFKSEDIKDFLHDFYELAPNSSDTKLSECLDKLYDLAYTLYQNDQKKK